MNNGVKQGKYIESRSVFYSGILLLNEKELKKWRFLNERFKDLCAQLEEQLPNWGEDSCNDGVSIAWTNTRRQFSSFENSLKPISRKRAKECGLHYEGSVYITFTRKQKTEYFYTEKELISYRKAIISTHTKKETDLVHLDNMVKVLILCPFCGKKYEQGLWQCPYCGA